MVKRKRRGKVLLKKRRKKTKKNMDECKLNEGKGKKKMKKL